MSSKDMANKDLVVKVQLFPFQEGAAAAQQPRIPFHFSPVEQELPLGSIIRVGRKIDKSKKQQHQLSTSHGNSGSNASCSFELVSPAAVPFDTPTNTTTCMDNNVAQKERSVSTQSSVETHQFPVYSLLFRSKVISRAHGEFLIGKDGKLYYRDVGSSSGSFLDRVRCSPSGKASEPVLIESTDILQLGVDYQSRTEDIFKSVSMKIFVSPVRASSSDTLYSRKEDALKLRSALISLLDAVGHPGSSSTGDCCICLSPIAPQQCLFLSPCSHVFHYKCCSPLVSSGVLFVCPLCRQAANLDANISDDVLSLYEEDIFVTEQPDPQDLIMSPLECGSGAMQVLNEADGDEEGDDESDAAASPHSPRVGSSSSHGILFREGLEEGVHFTQNMDITLPRAIIGREQTLVPAAARMAEEMMISRTLEEQDASSTLAHANRHSARSADMPRDSVEGGVDATFYISSGISTGLQESESNASAPAPRVIEVDKIQELLNAAHRHAQVMPAEVRVLLESLLHQVNTVPL